MKVIKKHKTGHIKKPYLGRHIRIQTLRTKDYEKNFEGRQKKNMNYIQESNTNYH